MTLTIPVAPPPIFTRAQFATNIYHLRHGHRRLWRWGALAVGHPPFTGVGWWHLTSWNLNQNQISSNLKLSSHGWEEIFPFSYINHNPFSISELFATTCEEFPHTHTHTHTHAWNELEVANGTTVPSLQWPPLLNSTRLPCLINCINMHSPPYLTIWWWQ